MESPISILHHHEHIQVRLGIPLAASARTVQDDVLHPIAKLLAQTGHVL